MTLTDSGGHRILGPIEFDRNGSTNSRQQITVVPIVVSVGTNRVRPDRPPGSE